MSNDDTNKKRKHNDLEVVYEKHLDWTATQGRCLTGGGRAEELYTADRGYPFTDSELPHFHLLQGDTRAVFAKWVSTKTPAALVTGAWNRPLFCGGWDHTTDRDDRVYNLQSHNLFVDLRIPRTREKVFNDTCKSLIELTPLQLRLFARQHVFAGFAVMGEENGQPLCTRHHCIDWNFVGHSRPRPNKWWIHMNEDHSQWKESSYATDERGQYYYFERWERRSDSPADGHRVALRKSCTEDRDGIFVLVGDHFNYVLARRLTGKEKDYGQTSLVALVDAAVDANDLETARNYLSMEAGHGTVSSGWKLDCAIPHWKEGTILLWDRASILIQGNSQIVWGDESWDVLDNSFQTLKELVSFLSA